MAMTMIFALVGSLVLSLTLMPVLASLLLPRRTKENDPLLVRVAKRVYTPVLDLALRLRVVVLVAALALIAGGAFLATQMGGEFLPKLGEGAIVGTTVRLEGISVEESVAQNDLVEQRLLAEFPTRSTHLTRLGTAEVATWTRWAWNGRFLPCPQAPDPMEEGPDASRTDGEDA
jgi:cobalt-zinc-cadmium resistance protein CzcA